MTDALADIDHATPVYLARMRALTVLQRRVVAALAFIGGQGLAREVARQARLPVNTVSCTLHRLAGSVTWADVAAWDGDPTDEANPCPRRPWVEAVGPGGCGRAVVYRLTDQRLGAWLLARRSPRHHRQRPASPATHL